MNRAESRLWIVGAKHFLFIFLSLSTLRRECFASTHRQISDSLDAKFKRPVEFVGVVLRGAPLELGQGGR